MAEQIEQLLKAIDEVGETVHQKYDEIKVKYQRLESELEDMQMRKATSGIGATKTDKSLTAQVSDALQSSNAQVNLKSFIEGRSKTFELQTKDLTLGDNYTGGTSALNGRPLGIISPVALPRRIADLMPRLAMDSPQLPIIEENGVTGTFTPVAEGALKPLIDFSLAESGAKAQVIAGIVVVSRQFIEDLGVVNVQGWLTSRMTELYQNSLADQILNGNGVSPNLIGLNRVGGFTAATSAATNDLEQLVAGILQMRTSGRRPTGIVINPDDLGRILLNKASGSGSFDVPSYVTISATGDVSVLGVPVITEPGQVLGRYNILDASRMLMGIRENFRIQAFEQDSDNVRTNKITFRGESRIAFVPGSILNNIQGTF